MGWDDLETKAPDHDILEGCEFGKQVVKLKDEPDLFVSEERDLFGRHNGDIPVTINNGAPVWLFETPRRWSRVLFPDPDAPTMAIPSALCAVMDMPRSTSMTSGLYGTTYGDHRPREPSHPS